MTLSEQLQQTLSLHKTELYRLYRVNEIGLFGSYVRNEQTESSDVDILVNFEEKPGLIAFCRLRNYLSDLTGKKVDLVTKDSLKPRIMPYILSEVKYL